MDFKIYLQQFLTGNLNQILESNHQSKQEIEDFFKFSRRLELNHHINRYSIIELFVQLFDGCNLKEGLLSSFSVLQDQIYKYGLIMEDHADNLLYNADSNPNCEYLMIRLCKSIVKQLKSSGLNFEGEMKTHIKSLLARTIPLCHRSGLNLSGRFSGSVQNARDAKRALFWIDSSSEGKQDQAKAEEMKRIEQTREYKIYQNFWRL